ncbi:MAG: hypothetical protein MJZ23_00590 [Paludibacteraceae bacterium]|nr:hypothetical protein [Paludibacteraceae bacterium]
MKKILLFIFAIGALMFSSCSKETFEETGKPYVSVSGNWEMHVTGSKGQDSIIKRPNRIIHMTWSDMIYDSTLNQTVISSQVTIGNGAWNLVSYIDGDRPGTYTMQDSSRATYTYTTKPSSSDSLKVIDYKLTGKIIWEKGSNKRFGNLSIDAVAATEDGKEVYFVGTAESALAR